MTSLPGFHTIRSRRGRRRGLALASVVVLTLTACGGVDSGADQAGPIDREATLVFADSTGDSTLDPARSEGALRSGPLALVYDRLIHLTPDLKLVPGLASEWKFSSPTTLDLTLRKNVVFHDGAKFTADAVVANLERSMTFDAATGVITDAVRSIKSVKAVDDYHVVIKMSHPDSTMAYQLAGPVGMMISPDALDNPDIDVKPVGAGMYRVVEFAPGDRIIYERFDDYWDPKAAAVKRFEFRVIGDAESRLNAVQSGQIDLTFIEARQLKRAKAAGLNTKVVDTLGTWGLFINNSKGALGDPKVRQAINYAIDRKAIVDGVMFGLGQPTPQLFPPDYFAFDPDHSMETYEFNPGRARELLREAGATDLTFSTFIYNRPEDIALGEVLEQMLGDVGITLDLRVLDPAQVQAYTDGTLDLMVARWSGRPDPLLTLEALYGPEGSFNPGKQTTKEIVDQLAAAHAEFDDEARTKLLQELSALGTKDFVSVVPMFTRTVPYVFNDCVRGFTPYQFGGDEFRGVGMLAGCQK